MNQNELIKDRLKNIMLSDKLANIGKLTAVLKNDLVELFQNYMYINSEDIDIKIDHLGEKSFVVNIKAKTDCLIDCGKMID